MYLYAFIWVFDMFITENLFCPVASYFDYDRIDRIWLRDVVVTVSNYQHSCYFSEFDLVIVFCLMQISFSPAYVYVTATDVLLWIQSNTEQHRIMHKNTEKQWNKIANANIKWPWGLPLKKMLRSPPAASPALEPSVNAWL